MTSSTVVSALEFLPPPKSRFTVPTEPVVDSRTEIDSVVTTSAPASSISVRVMVVVIVKSCPVCGAIKSKLKPVVVPVTVALRRQFDPSEVKIMLPVTFWAASSDKFREIEPLWVPGVFWKVPW